MRITSNKFLNFWRVASLAAIPLLAIGLCAQSFASSPEQRARGGRGNRGGGQEQQGTRGQDQPNDRKENARDDSRGGGGRTEDRVENATRGTRDSGREARRTTERIKENADRTPDGVKDRTDRTTDRGEREANRNRDDANRTDRDARDKTDRRDGREESARNDHRGNATTGRASGKRDFGASINVGNNNRLTVSNLHRDSYARRAGFRDRDVIVSVNGHRIGTRDDFDRWYWSSRGRRIPIIIIRDGVEETLYVNTLAFDNGPRGAWLGVAFDSRYEDQARVSSVDADSAADRAGIRAGDRIYALNGREVQDSGQVKEFVANHAAGDRVEIEFGRSGDTRTREVELGERPAE